MHSFDIQFYRICLPEASDPIHASPDPRSENCYDNNAETTNSSGDNKIARISISPSSYSVWTSRTASDSC